MPMTRSIVSTLTVVMLAGVAAPALAVPILVNGSLTGGISNGGVPSGWSILAGSPDTMDQNNNVGVGGSLDFGAVPSGPSPDGGTWVGMGSSGTFIETFAQSVGGFAIGQLYQLSWYAGNFGYSPNGFGYVNPNAIETLVGGVSIGAGSTLALSPDWTLQSLVFTATAANLQIAFQLDTTATSYMSIDGITLTEVDAVPEPTTLALLGAGLVAVRARRRRSS